MALEYNGQTIMIAFIVKHGQKMRTKIRRENYKIGDRFGDRGATNYTPTLEGDYFAVCTVQNCCKVLQVTTGRLLGY